MDEISRYIEADLLRYFIVANDAGENVLYPDLQMKLSQYPLDDLIRILERLIENEYISHPSDIVFRPGKFFHKWRELMSDNKQANASNININTVNGPVHLGQGDININGADVDSLITIIKELASEKPKPGIVAKVSSVLKSGAESFKMLKNIIDIGKMLV